MLSGSNSLSQGQRCDFAFTATIAYPAVTDIPTSAQKNTVYASGSSTPANPGHTVPNNPSTPVSSPTNAVTVDESTDRPVTPQGAPGVPPPAPGVPGTPGSDVPDPTPVSFVSQLLDVLKSASIPVQIDTSGKRFRVAYAVTVANTGAIAATNVQAGENLKFTFPAPATFQVTSVSAANVAGATQCVSNLNSAFDGGAGFNSASDVKNYNLFRLSTDASNKASDMSLPPGAACNVSFVVEVDYSAGTVPNASTVAQNRVFGQSASAPNEGATFDPATGTKTGDSPNLINKDTSEAVVPGVPTYGATPPVFPAVPTTPKQAPGSSTNAPFATLETVKKVAGPVTRTGLSTFLVPYEVTVQAVGNTSAAILNQVQAVDSLAATYNAGAPVVTVTPALAGTPIAGAACSVNAAFNGTSDIRLLAGTDDWSVGQGCTFRFTATVAYPSVAAIPQASQNNTVYASALTPGAAANPGGTIDPATGNWTEPNPGAGQQVVAKDRSTDGAPIPPSSGLDTPAPTPVTLVPPPVIAGVKYAELIGTPGGAAIPGATIRWTIIYKNTTSQTATDVRVTDVLNPQLRNPVIVSVSPASFTANPSYTGEGINTQLINPGTLAPGEKLTIVLESVVRATATGPQLTNQAVLSAAELGGPGGITVPTSAVDNTTPVCPQAVACRPDSSVVVPTSAIPNQNTVVGAPTGVPFTLAGSISGRVWNETNGDRQFNPGEQGLQGFRVAVFAINPVLPAGPDRRLSEITNPNNRPTTDANGLYTVSGLPPTNAGLSYEVVFFNENGDAILGVPRGNNANTAINGTPTLARDALTNVRVLPAQETTLQDLPLDPSGVVYDSSTRQPIAGATVQLVRVVGGVATPVPNGDLVGGSNSVVTGPSGLYQFILQPGAPAGEYRLQVTTAPAGYNTLSTNIPPSPGPVVPGGAALCPGQVAGQTCPVQAQSTPPLAGNPTTYYLSFTLTPGTSPDVIHNHIPLDSSTASGLSISKLANKSTAEIGDNVKYTIEVRNNAGGCFCP
ncbi:MAG: DUF11 domain-containing protein, partial [Brachymonas sp.]|nr:DUF11 domain-containing protein [Brachymonas sp.]